MGGKDSIIAAAAPPARTFYPQLIFIVALIARRLPFLGCGQPFFYHRNAMP